VVLSSLSQEIGKQTGSMQVATGFLVGLCILLIACSNIAGMYLSRTVSRGKEMTVRLALGAKKGRLARQLLSESLLLVPVAIGIGLVLTWYGGSWVTASIPFESRGFLPNYGRILMDWTTIAYAIAVAAVSVFLFSLAPMLESASWT